MMLPLSYKKDPTMFQRQCTELARRLDLTVEEMMHMPIIKVAKMVAAKNVTGGLQVVA